MINFVKKFFVSKEEKHSFKDDEEYVKAMNFLITDSVMNVKLYATILAKSVEEFTPEKLKINNRLSISQIDSTLSVYGINVYIDGELVFSIYAGEFQYILIYGNNNRFPLYTIDDAKALPQSVKKVFDDILLMSLKVMIGKREKVIQITNDVYNKLESY